VWVLKRKLRKELTEAYDTISSESASKYINDYYLFEQLGMTIKHKRNQKLLKSIRAKVVLRILQQEKEFDEMMFKRIRNRSKEKQKEKEKE
jgi:hemerythrin superfamily protein